MKSGFDISFLPDDLLLVEEIHHHDANYPIHDRYLYNIFRQPLVFRLQALESMGRQTGGGEVSTGQVVLCLPEYMTSTCVVERSTGALSLHVVDGQLDSGLDMEAQ